MCKRKTQSSLVIRLEESNKARGSWGWNRGSLLPDPSRAALCLPGVRLVLCCYGRSDGETESYATRGTTLDLFCVAMGNAIY